MPRPDDSQPHLAAIARAAAETRWRNSVIVALEAVEQGQFIDPGDAVRPGRPLPPTDEVPHPGLEDESERITRRAW
jgi:hypothetical protein